MKVIAVRQAVLDVWKDFNRPLEGRVPYMYLDVKGHAAQIPWGVR